MTLQELRYFIALADHGHFGRAAEVCHVSQPTLSTQLKKLEDELGVALFERTNKTLEITPSGRSLLPRAREVVEGADAILVQARRRALPMSGTLSLGIIPTLSPYLLPWLLPALSKTYPAFKLAVQEDLTANLLQSLKAHRIDAAMIALPVDDADLVAPPLFDEPFVLACATGDPLAKKKTVKPEDLKGAGLLLLTDGHCLRDQALALCGLAAANGEAADFRATSLETIRQMVAAGMGCTLLPAMALDAHGHNLETRPIRGDAFRRIGLAWRKSFPNEGDLLCLADLVRRHAPASVRIVTP